MKYSGKASLIEDNTLRFRSICWDIQVRMKVNRVFIKNKTFSLSPHFCSDNTSAY